MRIFYKLDASQLKEAAQEYIEHCRIADVVFKSAGESVTITVEDSVTSERLNFEFLSVKHFLAVGESATGQNEEIASFTVEDDYTIFRDFIYDLVKDVESNIYVLIRTKTNFEFYILCESVVVGERTLPRVVEIRNEKIQ